jgi:Tol biopolymer transport system component
VARDRLAFANEEGIHLANPDGSGMLPLAVFPERFNLENLHWSFDGRRLAYLGHTDCIAPECTQNITRLYVVNGDGTAHHQAASWPASLYTLSKWSPDSRYFLIYQPHIHTGHWHNVVNVETTQTVCSHSSMACCFDREYYAGADTCDPFRLSDDRWWSMRYDTVVDWAQVYGLWWEPPATGVYGRHFSPDGQWVLLQTRDRNEEAETSTWYIARTTRTNSERGYWTLDSISEHDTIKDVAWAKDSERFAIRSQRDGQSFIWIGHVGDRSVSLLAELGQSSCWYSLGWSASGHHISCAPYVIDWPSGQTHFLDEGPWYVSSWSPEGDYIMFRGQEFQVWDAGRHTLIPLGDEIVNCMWAPDDPWLACWSETTVTVFNLLTQDTIHADVAGVGVLEWSPSGQWVGFCACESAGEIWTYSLYTVDITTRQIVQIMGEASLCDIGWYPVLVEDE